MNAEHVKANIGNALDLLQIITEDVEESFILRSIGKGEEA